MMKEKIKNFFVAIFLSANLISYSLGNYDYNKIIYLLSLVIIILLYRKIILSLPCWILFFVTIIECLFSMKSLGPQFNKAYFYYFIIFSFFSLIVISERVKLKEFSYSMSIVLTLSSILLIRVFTSDYDVGMLLGISYCILPNYLCSIYVLSKENKNLSSPQRLLLWYNILTYGLFFLVKANRGSVLCILVYFILKYIFSKRTKNSIIIFKLAVFIPLFYIIINNFEKVFLFLKKVNDFLGIHIYVIDKTINLILLNQNVDSGRFFLIEKVGTMIISTKDLFVGKGIGYYESQVGIYTHNLFVQYFVEGGLLYLLVPVIFIFLSFILLFELKERDLIILLLSSVIIPLTLSNVHWLNPLFWLTLYYVFSKITNRKKILKI